MRLLVAVLLLVGLGALGAPQTKPKKSMKTLKTDLSKIRRKQTAVKSELRATKRQVTNVRGDIHEVDRRLGRIEESLDTTVERLASSKVESQSIAKELVKVTAELSKKTQELRTRLRQIYVRGEGSLASVISGSASLGDLASRQYVFERIARKDRSLFDDVQQLRKRVVSRKRRADQLVVEIRGLLDRQKTQQASMQDARFEKTKILTQLKGKQEDLEALVREFDAEENSIAAKIAAYSAGSGKLNGLKRPGRLLMPCNGRIGSGFGMRFHPILHRSRMHKGLDIAAPTGTPIHSAADGVVISASYMNGFGNCLIIDHGGGVQTVYGHCSRLLVGEGARVKRGQVVAKVGSTGMSTGPHCSSPRINT